MTPRQHHVGYQEGARPAGPSNTHEDSPRDAGVPWDRHVCAPGVASLTATEPLWALLALLDPEWAERQPRCLACPHCGGPWVLKVPGASHSHRAWGRPVHAHSARDCLKVPGTTSRCQGPPQGAR